MHWKSTEEASERRATSSACVAHLYHQRRHYADIAFAAAALQRFSLTWLFYRRGSGQQTHCENLVLNFRRCRNFAVGGFWISDHRFHHVSSHDCQFTSHTAQNHKVQRHLNTRYTTVHNFNSMLKARLCERLNVYCMMARGCG